MLKGLAAVLGVALLGMGWAGCEQAYFPVKEGWVWTYKSSPEGKTQTMRFSGVSPAGFTYVTQLSNGSVETRWKCEAGGLAALEFASSNLGGQNQSVNFKTVGRKGVMLPNTLGVGSQWSYSFTLEGAMSGGTLTDHMETLNKAVGLETITVPAGTFKALKVESTSTLKMGMNVGGKTRDLPSNTIQSTSWYAKGVGMVKSVTAGVTLELVSLKK
ncbi:hypothetical protein [Meiothermus granaticius]|uniref:DUF3108 domain-containing protein n=1 Tax=Meiothermus granaticius NBRC 107808 TaxID=1227551 RepID=A0A399FC91_9DEIN|nr:hypothetical protein [Meiothermus granaticius]RIH93823.1 hypothetical protein Mgrana_00172 [Meiothermus granaticius NBRC 107808]GEM86320.1 hypothetical protein MGR01S_09450 [Meiothermus granaticius NBRC 107808]